MSSHGVPASDVVFTHVRSFAFLLDFLREGVVEHLCNSVDFILELSKADMLRFQLLVFLLFLRKLVFNFIELGSDLSVSSALIINRATFSTFDRLPVSMLKLQRSCQQTERLTTVDLPEHECLGERDCTSETISPFLQLSEVSF